MVIPLCYIYTTETFFLSQIDEQHLKKTNKVACACERLAQPDLSSLFA